MLRVLDPFRFVVIAAAGWMKQRQLQIIDYLREENRRNNSAGSECVSTMTNAVDWPTYRISRPVTLAISAMLPLKSRAAVRSLPKPDLRVLLPSALPRPHPQYHRCR
jgi:hypothetical protein